MCQYIANASSSIGNQIYVFGLNKKYGQAWHGIIPKQASPKFWSMREWIENLIIPGLVSKVCLQTKEERPLFLKIAYNGPKAMEELASYDPENLIVGILGGSKGTTRDWFELIYKASKYGAKVALFGRKINLSEDTIGLVQLMRKVVEKDTKPEEAVKIYHDQLIKKKLTPDRNLKNDLRITDPILKL